MAVYIVASDGIEGGYTKVGFTDIEEAPEERLAWLNGENEGPSCAGRENWHLVAVWKGASDTEEKAVLNYLDQAFPQKRMAGIRNGNGESEAYRVEWSAIKPALVEATQFPFEIIPG